VTRDSELLDQYDDGDKSGSAETLGYGVQQPPPSIDLEIEWLYEEIADIARFRTKWKLDAELSSRLEAHRSKRFSRLRRLQKEQADRMEAAFRAKSHVPPLENNDLLQRTEKLLRKYEDSTSRHGSSTDTNPKES
jgi:hypothetical protein